MIKFFKSFRFALNGILIAFREQQNLKVQLVVVVLVVILGFYLDITRLEWVSILLSIGLVISAETVNTAIENAVDLITSEKRPLAGKIKDIAAGAVLIAAIIAFAIGCIIFVPYLFL